MKKLFTDHPASVGEDYLQHLMIALCFSGELLVAALACLVHALLSFLFVKAGSERVTSLYKKMVSHLDQRSDLSADDALSSS